MIIKFEKKTARVKGLCFHKKRSWLLISYHDGKIELFDYILNFVVRTYKEHFGPVRCVDFHNSQKLFVSGSDDNKIKVWDFDKAGSLFDLIGHKDYVRSVKFHHENPWILSASDDQTARIWNWQSRQCISILSGHNHYIMCAQFHPSKDFILTASLDETIRVWDISSLKAIKKKSRIKSFLDEANELSYSNGVFLKFILEDHQLGVNWAEFNPVENKIVSGSDDRTVKIWEYNENNGWEIDTHHEHFNNVSCVMYDPLDTNTILSTSEDKWLIVWKTNTNQRHKIHERSEDRFWVIAAHSSNGLMAAGHDNGFFLFMIRPEFSPSVYLHSKVYFIDNRKVKIFDTRDEKIKICHLLKNEKSYPKKILVNPINSDQNDIIFIFNNGKTKKFYYKLLNKKGITFLGNCDKIVFLNRNRFAVINHESYKDKSNKIEVTIKNTKNECKKSFITSFDSLLNISYVKDSTILFVLKNKVVLIDIIKNSTIKEAAIEKITNTVQIEWNQNKKLFALLTCSKIMFFDDNLAPLGCLQESSPIKNAIWHFFGFVLIYTTVTNLCYSLPNGENGILKTIKSPLKLLAMKNETTIFVLTRSSEIKKLQISNTEILLKRAAETNDIEAVASRLNETRLQKKGGRTEGASPKQNSRATKGLKDTPIIGLKTVDFLMRKNLSELALRFSKDPETMFEMALSCGAIATAEKCAYEIGGSMAFSKLVDATLRAGKFKVAEKALLRSEDLDRLSFLYYLSGKRKNLKKLLEFSEKIGDTMSVLQNSIYLGDFEAMVKMFVKTGYTQLAYITARRNGLKEHSDKLRQNIKDKNIIEKCESVLKCQKGETMVPLYPVKSLLIDWPKTNKEKTGNNNKMAEILKTIDTQNFEVPRQEKTITTPGNANELFLEEEVTYNDWLGELENLKISTQENPSKTRQRTSNSVPKEKNGYEKGQFRQNGKKAAQEKILQDTKPTTSSRVDTKSLFFFPNVGASREQRWLRGSASVMELLLGGKFGMASERLFRRFGVVDLRPLEPFYVASKISAEMASPMLPCLASDGFFCDDGNGGGKLRTVFGLKDCHEAVGMAFLEVKKRNIKEALEIFRNVVAALVLVKIGNKNDVAKAKKMLEICKNYILALRCSIESRQTTNLKRKIELLIYWTLMPLRPVEILLGLLAAINSAHQARLNKTLISLCTRFLELGTELNLPQQLQEQLLKVHQIMEEAEKTPQDTFEVDIDFRDTLYLDGNSLTLLKEDPIKCPYCNAFYGRSQMGKTCNVCELAKIGKDDALGFNCGV